LQLKFRAVVCICLAVGLVCACRWTASAHPAQEMLPDESAAKAKQVLQQVIAALGGPAYLNVHDTQCDGRIAQYGTAGTLMDYTLFREQWLLPDKNRIEFFTKSEHDILGFLVGGDDLFVTHGGALVTVYNGNQGWMLDKSGVSDEPEDLIQNFNDGLKTDMDHMLRVRLNEPGVEARYAGPDLIDLKEAEWIEFTDRDHRNLRLGVDKYTHLPLRWVIATRDPETGERTEITTSFVQYKVQDGVETPLSIEHLKNDRELSQTFLTECKFNSGLDPQLFTRASLEQRATEIKKKGYKNTKDTK
jgi:hypothetical protein